MGTATTRQDGPAPSSEWDWASLRSIAEAYERYAVPAWSRPLAEPLVELAALAPGERVLDVACGTGIVGRLAAEQVGLTGSVCGVDANADMLAVARVVTAGFRPPITWRQADAAALPVASESMDVVFCQQGLQFFADREAALREMRRALAPGGRVAVSVLLPAAYNPGWAAEATALERHLGGEVGALVRSLFPDGDAAELRELLINAGYSDVRVRVVVTTARYPSPEDVLLWDLAPTPLAGPLADLDDDTRAALLRSLAAELRYLVDDDGVVFPQLTYVALARRPRSDAPQRRGAPT